MFMEEMELQRNAEGRMLLEFVTKKYVWLTCFQKSDKRKVTFSPVEMKQRLISYWWKR